MSNVPILKAVQAAEAFRRLHWRRVAGALTAVAVGATLAQTGALTGAAALQGWAQLAYVITAISAYAALMRLAFVDEHAEDPEFTPGPGGLQWRKPEWRLVGVGALLFFLVLLIGALFFFAGLVVLVSGGIASAIGPASTPETLMEALPPGARLTVSMLALAFAVGILVLSVRLSLAPAATMARKEVVVFQTWALTKGQFWRIFVATFIVGLPSVAAGVVMALLLGVMGFDPTVPEARPAFAVALIASAVPGFVSGFITLPLSAGLTAYLYRGLRPADAT
jgi:hypothetical protein